MRRVIIESPYRGATPEQARLNLEYARRCLLDSLSRNEAPLASHLLYTQVLKDEFEEHRKWGILAGLAWAFQAELHVFYLDRGWSLGMIHARGHTLGKVPHDYRYLDRSPDNERDPEAA